MHKTGKYLVTGVVAGGINGLFGAGGGLFLVPLLIGYIGLEEKRAFATSVAIILPLSVVSFTLFCLQGENVLADAWPYVVGGIFGGLVSSRLFARIPTVWLHRLFGILILYGGVKGVLAL